MSVKTIPFAIVLLALFILAAGCSEEGDDLSLTPPVDNSTAQFKRVATSLSTPSQVRFSFRLTDAQNHAILIEPQDRESSFKIFEDGEEIDYSETSYFVRPASNLDLDIVLLLDFTNSMATWEENGENGIDLMVAWAGELIEQMGATHRIAIMEYHDRNLDAGVIAPFSTDKDILRGALDQFVGQTIDYGSSRMWDALYSAVELFDTDSLDDRRRLVILIGDGRETSSEKLPGETITLANQRQVSIFAVGTGAVTNEAALLSVATQTEGAYYSASDLAFFQEKLEQIKQDLGGQYELSYITLRSIGVYNVRIELNYDSYQGSYEELLDLGSVYGDDRIGVISFDEPQLTGSHLQVTVRAEHIPRNIDRFRFKPAIPKPFTISIPPQSEGGLLEGWSPSGPDYQGFRELTSDTPLRFGDYGVLFEIGIDNVVEPDIFFEFTFDTTIYSGGKGFNYDGYIVVGNPEFLRFDFETGDIGPLFTNVSALPWAIDSSNVYIGRFAISCGGFSTGGASTISIEIDVGFADTISFFLAAGNDSGVSGVGMFSFYIDNQEVMTQSGQLPYAQIVKPITPGTHLFAWRLLVGEQEISYNPRVWIDEIVLK